MRTPDAPSRKNKNNHRGQLVTTQVVVAAEVEETGDGRKCPFHFGLRTYFRDTCSEPQEKEIIETVDYLEESDFGYEDKIKKTCSWEKACMWSGVSLLLLGIIAVLIGQLSPPREVIYRRGALSYIDRKAISYNQRLELCRLIGLGAVCSAALLILLSFLLAAYSCPTLPPTNQGGEYCPVLSGGGGDLGGGIPLSGVLTTVQPPASPLHHHRR